MHPLTIFGLLFNSALICVNRFVKKLPAWLHLGGMLLGIISMIVGIVISRAL